MVFAGIIGDAFNSQIQNRVGFDRLRISQDLAHFENNFQSVDLGLALGFIGIQNRFQKIFGSIASSDEYRFLTGANNHGKFGAQNLLGLALIGYRNRYGVENNTFVG